MVRLLYLLQAASPKSESSKSKSESLEHNWSNHRRPTMPVTSAEALKEKEPAMRLKRRMLKRKQNEDIFQLKKQNLLLDIEGKKLELKKYKDI